MNHAARQDFLATIEATRRRYPNRPVETDWPLSEIPTERIAAVVADVFNSLSFGGEKTAPPITNFYSAAALGVPVAAFTYFDDPGEHYCPEDTHRSVFESAEQFAAYLPSSQDQTRIPTGASAGAAVALLGTAHWIRTAPFAWPAFARCVPRIILIAPAISPTPTLFDRYYEHYPDQVPLAIQQLCNVGTPEWQDVQQALVEAFALLAWAGIRIDVINWIEDILTPFPWHPSVHTVARPTITATRLAPPDLSLLRRTDPQFEKNAARMHVRFCSHEQTIATVRRLIESP